MAALSMQGKISTTPPPLSNPLSLHPCIRSLLTVYKSFIRPHLNYSDFIYHQSANASFSNKMEIKQYNPTLAITGAIKGSSRDKLYQELGLEYLQQRRRMRRLCLLYKFLSNAQPSPIHNLLLQM